MAALLALSLVVLWLPTRADALSCGKHVIEWTPSVKTPRTAYIFATGEWVEVYAAWGQQNTVATWGGCQDVNHRNLNRDTAARAMYWSSTYSLWAHGAIGWVTGTQNQWYETITNLPDGTPYRPGTFRVSTQIEVAT
jgi:hypothetical protein